MNTVKTSTYKKSVAKKNIMNFVYNNPKKTIPFSEFETVVYKECEGFSYIEVLRIMRRCFDELGIQNIGDITRN